MDFLLDALTNWLKEMLVGGIMGNLSGMFDSVNQQVADIATQVGQTPQGWNGSIFSMIQNLSNSIMVPIAGVILAIVDVDTWMIFKWVFKSAAAILLVTNTWNLVMAVFDMAQSVVAQASGIIGSDASIDISAVMTDMESRLMDMDLGPLFGLWFQSLFIGITMWALYICIFIVYRHYHVGAVYLHFHRDLWPYDRNLPCHVGGPHPNGDHDGQGMGRHGPELLAQPAGPGLPGVFDYRLCGDLRRTGAEHRHRGGHHHGDLELRGLYRAAVLHTVQNRQSRESSVSGALSQEGGNAKWLMYPYPKT